MKFIGVSKDGSYYERKYLIEVSHNEASKLFPDDVNKALENKNIGGEHDLEKHFKFISEKQSKAYALEKLVESLDSAIQLVIPPATEKEAK